MLRLGIASKQHKTDLRKARAPFQGCKVRLPLNNFLISYSSKRALVFLNEFNKARQKYGKYY